MRLVMPFGSIWWARSFRSLLSRWRDRFHTYRELQVGVHFRDRGFDLRYEREIGGQTPDWCLSNEDGSPREILDVFTLHQRHEKDVEISTAIRDSGQWDGWSTVPSDHIYRKLCDKAGQYSGLAKRINLTQVLAAHGEFTASVAPKEVHQTFCSFNTEAGSQVILKYPGLSIADRSSSSLRPVTT